MKKPSDNSRSAAQDWLEAELADSLDEDYELEFSEPALSMEIRKIYQRSHPPSMGRLEYFAPFSRCKPS